MKNLPRIVPALIILTCCGIAGIWLAKIVAGPPSRTVPTSRPQLDRRDFTLTDTGGHRVSLQTYEGKWLLMFFGFTSCPDVCPTAMANVSATLREMGDIAIGLQPIFITIDPERDTPQNLKEYLENFGENIIGLSGNAEETAAIAKSYGVYYKRRQASDGDYTMDHSSALYLVSPQGSLIRSYVPNTDPEEFAKELEAAIASEK